jgi:hypothetical protein
MIDNEWQNLQCRAKQKEVYLYIPRLLTPWLLLRLHRLPLETSRAARMSVPVRGREDL